MAELTKEEVAMWIRNLIPYLENPVTLAPKGLFDKDEIQLSPGGIIKYEDTLSPTYKFNQINQTENLKALIELYRAVGKDGE